MRVSSVLDVLDSQLFCTRTRCFYACLLLIFIQGLIYFISITIVHVYELSGGWKVRQTDQYAASSQHKSSKPSRHVDNNAFELRLPSKLLNVSHRAEINNKLMQRIDSIKNIKPRYQFLTPSNATLYDLMFLVRNICIYG